MGGSNCSLVNADGSQVMWNNSSFARGKYRRAYLGMYMAGPKRGKKCAVKAHIRTSKTKNKVDVADLYSLSDDIEISQICADFAAQFNEIPRVKDLKKDKKVFFVVPELFTVGQTARFSNVKAKQKVSVEDYIEGMYEKFISNNGTLLFNGTLGSFCHFTYHKSQGKLLVVDLQGVRLDDSYELTDPAIHSQEGGRYGDLDLGQIGIEAFFATHKCTGLCQSFVKPSRIRYGTQDCEDIMKSRDKLAVMPRKRDLTINVQPSGLTGGGGDAAAAHSKSRASAPLPLENPPPVPLRRSKTNLDKKSKEQPAPLRRGKTGLEKKARPARSSQRRDSK